MNKKLITICAAILMTASVFAQAPEKMSYQAVIRNSSDALLTSTAVGMRISILQRTATGIAVYVETQTPTTNTNGLVSLEIGAGTVVSGDFSTIDWASGLYFIKTETDPAGGANYSITGVSQLLSVPYALHAKTAGSIVGGGTGGDVASGQGMFKARHSNHQAITSFINETAVNFNTAIYNPDNAYSTSTSEFTAPDTGYYHFDVKLTIAGSAVVTNTPLILRIYQNSILVDQVSTYTSYNGSWSNGLHFGTNLSLNAGDKISVRVLPGTVATLSLVGGGTTAATTFSGYRVR